MEKVKRRERKWESPRNLCQLSLLSRFLSPHMLAPERLMKDVVNTAGLHVPAFPTRNEHKHGLQEQKQQTNTQTNTRAWLCPDWHERKSQIQSPKTQKPGEQSGTRGGLITSTEHHRRHRSSHYTAHLRKCTRT